MLVYSSLQTYSPWPFLHILLRFYGVDNVESILTDKYFDIHFKAAYSSSIFV